MTTSVFSYRFPSEEIRREFKVCAFNQNKSMNELMGEIIVRYLRETKRANT